MLGISIYNGMDYSLEENLNYLEMAHSYGVKTIFTSLHIPEADHSVFEETKELLRLSRKLDMQVIADVSKGFIDKFDLSQYQISALRLDFGFSLEEIVAFTKNYPFKAQINGSTISREYLLQLKAMGANFENIEVGHNYYPRRDTGISYDLLIERNRVFKEFGLKVMAFVPSQSGKKRGPVYEGLPTVEAHRDINPLIAAQHLLLADVDHIIIGDALAQEEELRALREIEAGVVVIPYKPLNPTEAEQHILSGLHTNRMDPGEFVIRSQEARERKAQTIIKKKLMERKKYFITIDNEGYLRYEGELQIMKRDHLPDDRVNVVGDAAEAGLLIDLIKPGMAFRLIPENSP